VFFDNEFVTMSSHVHGIIIIVDDGGGCVENVAKTTKTS